MLLANSAWGTPIRTRPLEHHSTDSAAGECSETPRETPHDAHMTLMPAWPPRIPGTLDRTRPTCSSRAPQRDPKWRECTFHRCNLEISPGWTMGRAKEKVRPVGREIRVCAARDLGVAAAAQTHHRGARSDRRGGDALPYRSTVVGVRAGCTSHACRNWPVFLQVPGLMVTPRAGHLRVA